MSRGALFADAREIIQRVQTIQVQKSAVAAATDVETGGVALRVFHRGQWGHAAASSFPPPDPETLAEEACENAASAGRIRQVPFSNENRLAHHAPPWATPCETDPMTISLEEKGDFLRSILQPAATSNRIAFCVANLFQTRRTVRYASSLGGSVVQTFISTWPNFAVTTFDASSRRIDSVNGPTEPLGIGYEYTKRFPFEDEVWKAMDLVDELQSAKPVTPGVYDLVLDPAHFRRILFETVLPHLDSWSVAGIDGQQPGTVLFPLASVGSRILPSPHATLRYDSRMPEGLATFGWDDAGRPADTGVIVREGVFTAPVGSDELFSFSPAFRGSISRAPGWQTPPRFTMPNILFEPESGETRLDDLVSSVKKGLLLEGRPFIERSINRKWFRVTVPYCRLIEGGKRTRMVRDIAYETAVTDFWKALARVGGRAS
ncbi:MAG: metallopeptidase TldD-related protein, partial [Bacteroidota bacterium]|nr:metallopeptidase TldD-related protein [Bacteroidota bacterium]